MTTNAIESVGVYTPRYRIDADAVGDAWDGFEARGVETKSVLAGDEDTITMAAAAGGDALSNASIDREEIVSLHLATTTPPVEEFDVGATLAAILGLPETTRTVVHSQSTNAGTRALRSGLETDSPALVVAADAPFANPDDAIDHAAGAGAVGFVCTPSGTVTLRDAATHTKEFPGTRFRERGSTTVDGYDATAYDRRAYTESIAAAVGRLAAPTSAVAMTAPDGSLPYRAARGLEGDVTVFHVADRFGDLGAASACFGLLAAWDDGADAVTVVGYGDGASVDALLLEGQRPVTLDRETESIGYASYLRKRGHIVGASGGDR